MKDEVEEDNMEEDKDEVGTCRSPCHCPGR